MWWKTVLDIYLVFIAVYFIAKLILSDRKMLSVCIIFAFVLGIFYLAQYFELKAATQLFDYYKTYAPIIMVIIIAPEIRRAVELYWQYRGKKKDVVMGSDSTKEIIIEATMELAKHQVGALMTIEKHNTLEPYAEKAVILNSNISKELLLNIFTPNTPLHDGAVIIRGDQILCAGAYFVLTNREDFEKTMGSRHRAGLGISEVTDSFTIVVSEETGSISIAIEGVMLKINDREKLSEYLSIFMR